MPIRLRLRRERHVGQLGLDAGKSGEDGTTLSGEPANPAAHLGIRTPVLFTLVRA
ncbi:hypothetical protein [Streptomyces sp. NPDC014656]|uniref:hypothetical protein n=1 Tax=Streptomyces sp. NPDC014656 TaxID=3364878 RepID=UPI003702EEBA